MEKYVRISETLNDKGLIVKQSEIDSNEGLKKLISKAPKTDWYRSLYCYSEEAVDYFHKNGESIAGYNGKVFTDKLTFDLDCESNLDKAKQDAKELLYRLQNAGINLDESVRIYFSGNKGFHIEVPVDSELNPDELKSICTNIANGLATFDPVVYNTNRIFRLPNTKHNKSGLFKIELGPSDIVELTIDQIKTQAKEPNFINFTPTPIKSNILNKFKTPLVIKPIKQIIVDADESGIRGMDQVDFTSCPKTKPRCIHALESGIMMPGVGQRNRIFLRMAAYYRNMGYTKDVAYNILKAVARGNAMLYPEAEPYKKDEIWRTVIEGTYNSKSFVQMPGSFGTDPENEVLLHYCEVAGKYTNRPCPLHNKVHQANTTMQIGEVHENFSKFAEEVDKNTVLTGIHFIDKNMKITTGTTSLLVGCTGSGKTTLALNILENSNKIDQTSIFFSMDMHKNLIYQKLAQKCTNYNRDQILEIYARKDKQKIEFIRNAIAERYGKTYFDFSKTLTMEQMRDKILEIEQKSGKKMKFVLIDYAGRIAGPYADTYANANYNALKSIEVAEVTDTAQIIISQISRSTGSEVTPLRTKRAAKESGTWEESASNVITMWRPFYGAQEHDDIVRLYLAKNRMGPEPEEALFFDGERGVIRDMTHQELASYNAERGDKAENEYRKQRTGRTL